MGVTLCTLSIYLLNQPLYFCYTLYIHVVWTECLHTNYVHIITNMIEQLWHLQLVTVSQNVGMSFL